MSGTPSLGTVTDGFANARLRFYRHRHEATTAEKIALALGFAALTGLAAQVRVYLPFTPVPITMQTFAVLLTGVALGARWGGASQAAYAALGTAGVPWFTDVGAGLGPTWGYVVGFVLAAVAVGYVSDRYLRARNLPALVAVLAAANFLLVYPPGLAWLYGWLALVKGAAPSLLELLTAGLFPYVVGDVVKLVGAALVARAMVPSREFGPEVDGGE